MELPHRRERREHLRCNLTRGTPVIPAQRPRNMLSCPEAVVHVAPRKPAFAQRRVDRAPEIISKMRACHARGLSIAKSAETANASATQHSPRTARTPPPAWATRHRPAPPYPLRLSPWVPTGRPIYASSTLRELFASRERQSSRRSDGAEVPIHVHSIAVSLLRHGRPRRTNARQAQTMDGPQQHGHHGGADAGHRRQAYRRRTRRR